MLEYHFELFLMKYVSSHAVSLVLNINISMCVYRAHLDLLALVERMVEMVCQDPLDPPDLVVAVETPVPL